MGTSHNVLFIFGAFFQVGESAQVATGFSLLTLSIQIIVIILGLILSALFSGSEVAFFSLYNQEDLLKSDQETQPVDATIKKLLEYPHRLLATILIGNTFANIVTAVISAVITGNLVAHFNIDGLLVYAIEIVVVTFVLLILSEITPKLIAINNPLHFARRLSGFIYVLSAICRPFSRLIARSTINLEEHMPKPDSKMTTEDIMTMAEVSEKEGSIRSDEREIIENVVKFGETTAHEIMVSRVDIVAISARQSLDEVLALIREKGLSRMPIYEDDLDNILGVIHSKDVLPYINSDIERTIINWQRIGRNALFIPSTKKLDDLLRDFQQEKTHMAIVVDEYGGTEGIITMDDILEEIVGDISDEYDEQEESLYTKFKNDTYIFAARIDLDDMEEVIDRELTSDDDEFETLGGLIYHLTERIPNVGERVYYKNCEFTIHSVQNNRVQKVRVKVQQQESSSKKKHHATKN